MAETVAYAGSDKGKMASNSAVPVTENFEPRAASPTSTTMSEPGIRTPAHDEEAQHTPPVWGQHRIVEEVQADVKTINIHIQINVPSTFKLPSFSRSKCQWKRRAQAQNGDPRPRSRFLAILLFVLYLSFIACGAAAWGIQDHRWMPEICHPPLIIATFVPFFDAASTISTIYLIRRYRDEDKPRARYVLNLLSHAILTCFLLVVLGFGAAWADMYTYWYNRRHIEAIAGLILYSSSTMLLMKIILFIFVAKNGGLRQKYKESVVQFPSMVKSEVEYQRLTSDCDDDATQIASARPSTEGRIFLD